MLDYKCTEQKLYNFHISKQYIDCLNSGNLPQNNKSTNTEYSLRHEDRYCKVY